VVSANAGWYPDPGGSPGLFRYWDGRAWSAAVSPNPNGALPPQSLTGTTASHPALGGSQHYGAGQLGPSGHGHHGYPGQQGSAGQPGSPGQQDSAGQRSHPGQREYLGQHTPGQPYGQGNPNAYADYRQAAKERTPLGWWIGAAAVVVVAIIVAVIAIRATTGGGVIGSNPGRGQATQDVCPQPKFESESPIPHPNDGRVHGGPVSYPELGDPWGPPTGDNRVPFGRDVLSQLVTVESNYRPGNNWVASVLVGELQAGDGFYTPEQGSQIVVKCILGAFYGENEVNSNVTVNRAATIDGHDAWLVESQLSFDITGLETKGELLIVAVVATGSTAGLFYASIPDTTPQLVQPARDALAKLQVDG
jgi:hypothetical protein